MASPIVVPSRPLLRKAAGPRPGSPNSSGRGPSPSLNTSTNTNAPQIASAVANAPRGSPPAIPPFRPKTTAPNLNTSEHASNPTNSPNNFARPQNGISTSSPATKNYSPSPTMNNLMKRYQQPSATQSILTPPAARDKAKDKLDYNMRRKSRSQGDLLAYYAQEANINLDDDDDDVVDLSAEPALGIAGNAPVRRGANRARVWGEIVRGSSADSISSGNPPASPSQTTTPRMQSPLITSTTPGSSPPTSANRKEEVIPVPPRPVLRRSTRADTTSLIERPLPPVAGARKRLATTSVTDNVGSADVRKIQRPTTKEAEKTDSPVRTRWSAKDLQSNKVEKEVSSPRDSPQVQKRDSGNSRSPFTSAQSTPESSGNNVPVRTPRSGLVIPPLALQTQGSDSPQGVQSARENMCERAGLRDKGKAPVGRRGKPGHDTDREAVIKMALINPRARSSWLYDVFALEAATPLDKPQAALSPRLKPTDIAPFEFCIYVESLYKCNLDDAVETKATARALYTKYLSPVLVGMSSFEVSRNTVTQVKDCLARCTNSAPPSTIFDAAFTEVMSHLEQTYHFPTFLEHYLTAFTELSMAPPLTIPDNTEGHVGVARRKITAQAAIEDYDSISIEPIATTQLQLPERLFQKFVDFVRNNEDESSDMLQAELRGSKNLSLATWHEEYHEGDHDTVDVSYCFFADHPNFPCYRGISAVSAPAKKVLDIIMSVTDRECWDDLFGNGRIEATLSESAQIRHLSLSVPRYKGRDAHSRDLEVFCGMHRMADGAYVVMNRSVNLSGENYISSGALKADAYISGFYIQPHPTDPMSCFVTAVSMLDIKGKFSEEAMRMVNYTQALAPAFITSFITSVEQTSKTMGLDPQYPPFVVYAAYNHSSENKEDTPNSIAAFRDDSRDKGKEREESFKRVPVRGGAPFDARVARKKVLYFSEGDPIYVLSTMPHLTLGVSSLVGTLTNRLPSPSSTPCWVGYCNGQFGVFDVDYVRFGLQQSKEQVSTAQHYNNDDRKRNSGDLSLILLDYLMDDPDLIAVSALLRIEDASTIGAAAFINSVRLAYPDRLTPMFIDLFKGQYGTFIGSDKDTIFREDDIFCKLLHAFCQTVGRSYLVSTLRPLITLVLTYCAEGRSFEVDPLRVKDRNALRNNIIHLSEMCTIFLTAITDSRKRQPRLFRQLLTELQIAVNEKVKTSNFLIFINFFFLRFFCPAIVSPRAYGVVHEDVNITKEARRGLVLISKVIQGLANGVEFGEKEEHMLPLNPWIKENRALLNEFLSSLGKRDESLERSSEIPLMVRGIPENVNEELRRLFMAFSDNLHTVAINFSRNNHGQSLESTQFPQLLETLIQAAPPVPPPESDRQLTTVQMLQNNMGGNNSAGRSSVLSGIKKVTYNKITKSKSSKKMDKIDGKKKKKDKEKEKEKEKDKDKDKKEKKSASKRGRRELVFQPEPEQEPISPRAQRRRSRSIDGLVDLAIAKPEPPPVPGHKRRASLGKSVAGSVVGNKVALPPTSPGKSRSVIGGAVSRNPPPALPPTSATIAPLQPLRSHQRPALPFPSQPASPLPPSRPAPLAPEAQKPESPRGVPLEAPGQHLLRKRTAKPQEQTYEDIESEKARIAAHITSLFSAEKGQDQVSNRYSLSVERQLELQRLLDYFADRVHEIDVRRQDTV